MKISQKINSPIKYYGGKNQLCRRIIPLMEYRSTYVEGFAGGLNVFLNIDEVFDKVFIFDKDPDVINLWTSLQKRGDEIRRFLLNVSYDKENFEQAVRFIKQHQGEADDFYYPAMYIIKNRFSRGAMGETFSWSDRLRGGLPGDENAWKKNILNHLPRVLEKIQGVHFECGCFRELTLGKNFGDDAVYYLDPPYVNESRTAKNVYSYEIDTCTTKENLGKLTHEGLIHFILQNRGLHYLSGYHNELYSGLIKEKVLAQFLIKNSAAQTKKKSERMEVLWKI